jgi:5-methylcytosine-specific restriction endonuclease McrA
MSRYVKKMDYSKRLCDFCNNEFIPKVHNQRFCSSECCINSNRERYSRDRFVIFERDNFRCFYCGRVSFENSIELQLDHVIPKIDGGKDIAINLVASCCDCNQSKYVNPITDIEAVIAEISRRNAIRSIPDNIVINTHQGQPQADIIGMGIE